MAQMRHEKQSMQNKPIKLKEIEGVPFKYNLITKWPLAPTAQGLTLLTAGIPVNEASDFLPACTELEAAAALTTSVGSAPLRYSPFPFLRYKFPFHSALLHSAAMINGLVPFHRTDSCLCPALCAILVISNFPSHTAISESL